MINLGNYEEYFILYMDNELSAEGKLMVEAFITQHPHLGEELELLLSTKLPFDEVSFTGKEELLSPSMKVNTVDEHLLLYIDNELPSSQKNVVEQKIAANKDYALQYTTLLQTKLDASEKISHPNKKELYRHTERVVFFKTWTRIAAAIVILLFGSLFFILNKEQQTIAPITASTNNLPQAKPGVTEQALPSEKLIPNETTTPDETSVAQAQTRQEKQVANPSTNRSVNTQKLAPAIDLPTDNSVAYEEKKRDIVAFDVKQFTQPELGDVAVKNTLAYSPVTSSITTSYNNPEDTPEPADPSGDFKNTKKSSAKGLFRKVTRFIGRNTGIGTADVGEEVLIGAVALKLK